MSHDVAQERITTEEDGPETVNERLSAGGPGPNGEPDTVTERLSGSQDASPEPTLEPADETETEEAPKKPAKKAAKKS